MWVGVVHPEQQGAVVIDFVDALKRQLGQGVCTLVVVYFVAVKANIEALLGTGHLNR